VFSYIFENSQLLLTHTFQNVEHGGCAESILNFPSDGKLMKLDIDMWKS